MNLRDLMILYFQQEVLSLVSLILQILCDYNLAVMRTLSPVRSTSPLQRPKVVFHYPPSPLRERSSNLQPPSPLNIHKSPEKRTIVSGQVSNLECDSCSKCQKQSVYRDLNQQGRRYCSECGIKQRKQGAQIVRIELREQPFYRRYHQKQEKQNFGNQNNFQTSNCTYESGQSGRIEPISGEVESLRGELKTMLTKLSDKDFANDGVREIYRQKKLILKNHYERIKAAIKQSIERDLAELQKRQARSLQCLQEVKSDLSKTVGFKIKEEAKSFDENRQQLQRLKEKRKLADNLIEQLSIPRQEMKELASDSLEVRLTNQQINQASSQLYTPLTFTLFADRPSKTLFSFQQKHPA